jgi:hypothetical protein
MPPPKNSKEALVDLFLIISPALALLRVLASEFKNLF